MRALRLSRDDHGSPRRVGALVATGSKHTVQSVRRSHVGRLRDRIVAYFWSAALPSLPPDLDTRGLCRRESVLRSVPGDGPEVVSMLTRVITNQQPKAGSGVFTQHGDSVHILLLDQSF